MVKGVIDQTKETLLYGLIIIAAIMVFVVFPVVECLFLKITRLLRIKSLSARIENHLEKIYQSYPYTDYEW